MVQGEQSTPPAVDTNLTAFTEDTEVQVTPAGGIHLTPVLGEAHRFFDPFRVDGVIGETGTFEVPSGAFSWAQQVFVFTHIWESENNPGRVAGCYLVSKSHPFHSGPFTQRFRFSPVNLGGHDVFSGVCPVVVRNAEHPWLPPTDAEHGVVLFGIGYNPRPEVDYSAIHLAWAPLETPDGPRLG